jgi:hypothetical protein
MALAETRLQLRLSILRAEVQSKTSVAMFVIGQLQFHEDKPMQIAPPDCVANADCSPDRILFF